MGYFFNIVADAHRDLRVESRQVRFAQAKKLVPTKTALDGRTSGDERAAFSPDVNSSIYRWGFPSPEEFSGETLQPESRLDGDSPTRIGEVSTEVENDVPQEEPSYGMAQFASPLADDSGRMEVKAEGKPKPMPRLNGDSLESPTGIPATYYSEDQASQQPKWEESLRGGPDEQLKPEISEKDAAFFESPLVNEQTRLPDRHQDGSGYKPTTPPAPLDTLKENAEIFDKKAGESALPRSIDREEEAQVRNGISRHTSVTPDSTISSPTTNLNVNAERVQSGEESSPFFVPRRPVREASYGIAPNIDKITSLNNPALEGKMFNSTILPQVEHTSTAKNRQAAFHPQVIIGSIEVVVEAAPAQPSQPASGLSRDFGRYYLGRL